MFAEGENYTLIINNVYGVDADEYVCRAVNKGGVKSTKAELVIMSKSPYQDQPLFTKAKYGLQTCIWGQHM